MNNALVMLPEWSETEAVMLAWPHACTDWAPWLELIQRDYVELAVSISTEVVPLILCQDAEHEQLIRMQLGSRCIATPLFVQVPYNDTWCRDYGPITCSSADVLQLLDFRFQGWGDKYDATLDDSVNAALQSRFDAELESVAFELEGGSIETDGAGTLLTTTHCLLDSNRNKEHTQETIEKLLQDKLGIERILWISEGALLGDDTDSHIDNLVRFCSEDTIAYTSCSNEADEHYLPLARMAEQVKALRRTDGSTYKILALELPEPQIDEEGKRLPGSYANFLILNGSVLVPVFGCRQDALALNALQSAFPDRKLVTVPGSALIRQFGGPHCATMQLPRGVLKHDKSV